MPSPAGARCLHPADRTPPRTPRAGPSATRPAGPHRPAASIRAQDRRSPTRRRPAAASRDCDAPRPVQRRDVGHRAQPWRHVHADSDARRRHISLAQHRPAVTGRRPVPTQRASVTARPTTTLSRASRAAKLIPGNRHLHMGTLLIQPRPSPTHSLSKPSARWPAAASPSIIAVYQPSELALSSSRTVVIAAVGALGPESWPATATTVTALRAEQQCLRWRTRRPVLPDARQLAGT